MFVLNFRRGKPWLTGVIILRRAGPLLFMVGITNGQVFRRHLNHMRTLIADLLPEEQDIDEFLRIKGANTEWKFGSPATTEGAS